MSDNVNVDERYYSNSIFWVEVDRISPNPYQPRKIFDEAALQSLADSIRQYGVLQPLVVTRKEEETEGGGLSVSYELISGERRLRASKLAGVQQVPVVIRSHEESDKMKLELAIIENLQREDLNPIDRAKAFQQLVEQFKLKHIEVGKRIGRSREYVSNTLRLLALPQDMQEALGGGLIMEGHTRPLLMLVDRPEEQQVLFKEIMDKKMTVRESERIARRIAVDRARKKDLTPEMLNMERDMTEALGTRVTVEKKEKGGKVHIDFFTDADLDYIRRVITERKQAMEAASAVAVGDMVTDMNEEPQSAEAITAQSIVDDEQVKKEMAPATTAEDSIPADQVEQQESTPPVEEDDLYSIRNFSV